MTLALPLHVRLRRLPRSRCSNCGRRRVLFNITVEPLADNTVYASLSTEEGAPDPQWAANVLAGVTVHGVGAKPLCSECAGMVEPAR